LPVTGVGAGAPGGDDGLPLGCGERLGVGELLGEPLGDGGGDVDDAGHVCDRLKNVAGCLAPVAVSIVADAAVSCAPGAENAKACASFGGPKVVMVCVPPGLNVTVSVTKTF
jgi:hypothetical protein